MQGDIWVETGELLKTVKCISEYRPLIKASLQGEPQRQEESRDEQRERTDDVMN